MLTSKASTPDTAQAAAPMASVSGAVSNPVIMREAIIVALLVAGFTAIFARGDLGAGLHPHPGWAAVILLSARYCSRGFAFSVAAVWGALTLTGLCMGLGFFPLVAMSNSVPDLVALVISVLVAWVASAHERRIGDLTTAAVDLAQHKTQAGTIIAALRDAALALRARADRFGHSLTFIREVSARLEGCDPLAASEAALELAIARTGARAGVVQLNKRRRLRTFASMGAWTLQRAVPPDLFADATIRAAFEGAKPVLASDLPEPGRNDSDVAVPITDNTGSLLGILALRGVPSDSLSQALVNDLALIGRWCSKATALTQAPEISIVASPLGAVDHTLTPFAWDAPTVPALRVN
jgi:hypothetical protein